MNDAGFNNPKPWRFPMEILAVIGFLAVWVLLQLVVLPKIGVST